MTMINDLHLHKKRMMNTLVNQSIDELIIGEISTVEAYKEVLKKLGNDPQEFRLERFLDQHKNAVNYWQRQVKREGRIPQKTSNGWGKVVEAVVGVSKILGNETTLRALKALEEHGLANYESMLTVDNFTPMQKREISQTFIPRQRLHIESIDAMINLH